MGLPARTTPHERGGLTRRRILTAARELFAVHGFEGTTVKMIAERCELTDPALYYHFNSKREIHDALLVQPVLRSRPIRGTPRREQVVEAALEIFLAFGAEPDLVRMILRDQLGSGRAGSTYRGESLATYLGHVAGPLRMLYGEDGDAIAEALYLSLWGMLWDGVLSYGRQFEDLIKEPYFRKRVRALIELTLPPVPSSAETA